MPLLFSQEFDQRLANVNIRNKIFDMKPIKYDTISIRALIPDLRAYNARVRYSAQYPNVFSRIRYSTIFVHTIR